jgi:uncharacterized protein YndB with AHSA1/START domain
MMRIEHSVEIKCPVDEVFGYITKPENTPQWQAGMLESQQVSEGPMRVGTIFTEVRQMMGRKMHQKMEVTEYEPNQKWSFRSIEAPVPHEAHLVFESIGDGTRVSLNSLGKPTGLFRLLSPLIRRQLKGQFEADFENLKQLLESNG